MPFHQILALLGTPDQEYSQQLIKFNSKTMCDYLDQMIL